MYVGALPETMTLRNCWGWRFDGNRFTEAPADVRAPHAVRLLEHNRRALMRVLVDKVNELRKPYVSEALLGDELRRLKLEDARAYLNASGPAGSAQDRTYSALQAVAVSRNASLKDTAELICKRAEQTNEVLIATERVRERFALLIAQAKSDGDLLWLRAVLVQEVYPELARQFRFVPDNTEPSDPTARLSEHHLVHEIARLKAQLREEINRQRTEIDAGYLAHTEVLKFKAQIAHWVLAPSGEAPAGVDLLEDQARHSGLTLEAAAKRVLAELARSGAVLSSTERLKDQMLSRIDKVQTLEDVRQLDAELQRRG
ncbi:hypothetical protein [Trinickia fusca]|nr:hypothetical protein [Trinickia fusca]